MTSPEFATLPPHDFDPWYQHGNLPHNDDPDKIQFITWHLADSLPVPVQQRLLAELQNLPLTETERETERRRRMEKLLDRGYGDCLLRRHKCADIIHNTLRENNSRHYDLHAYVIMPNHLHILAQFYPGNRMGDVVAEWKSVSAPLINAAAGRKSELYHENYWDRYQRDADHYDNTLHYIRMNPVRAGLVKNPNNWKHTFVDPTKKFNRGWGKEAR
jgi:putative DNA methylase